MKRSYNWKLWTIVAAIAVFEVLLVFAAVGCEVEESADGGTSKPAPTEVPVLSISAQDLYDAREANATRYDAQYKGKRVRVSGQVVKIDGGDVTLGVDATGFGIDTMGLFGVDLTDLSKEEQISLDKGDTVSAVCKVGDYIIGSIRMKDCELD